jgi:ketosteroid isomerase-like protein
MQRGGDRRIMSEEDIITEYFRLVTNKDIDGLLNMFAQDAVVYEPFSKSENGLRGRAAIEPFLRVVMMANDELEHTIVTEKKQKLGKMNQVTALVTFEKGDKIRGRFTFELDSDNGSGVEGRIKSLHIQF